jgi:hypothetical protein
MIEMKNRFFDHKLNPTTNRPPDKPSDKLDKPCVWRLMSALWPFYRLCRWQMATIICCILAEMAFNAAVPLSLKALP